ncbi:MAG: LSm family protein [Thermoplasmata archaeon]|jgi:small nuclear ribonucleoprotein
MATGPAHALEQALHQRVSLVLKDGRTISGELLGMDEHLNLVLDHSEESTPELTRRLGRLIVRGSSVTSLHAPGRVPAKAP